MSFNPDPSKHAVEIHLILHSFILTINYWYCYSGWSKASWSHTWSGSGLWSSSWWKSKKSKSRYLLVLFVDLLVTIFKTHVRPHLDYGNILYDRPGNLTFLKNSSPFNMMLVSWPPASESKWGGPYIEVAHHGWATEKFLNFEGLKVLF